MISGLANTVQTVPSDELYNVLYASTTQDPVLVVASSERLKTLLTMFGTLDGLSSVAAQKSLPLQVRQQSAIQLKNAVQHSWRSRKLLSDQHRLNIRSRSLSLLDEEEDIIAQCNSVVIGKIARMDYPTNWPTLITDLVAVITNNFKTWTVSNGIDTMSGLILRRSLEIINGVLKEMITMKMITGVKTMSQVAEQISVILQDQFVNLSVNVLNYFNLDTIALPQANDSIRLSHLSFKCLVKLSNWLWQRIEVSDLEHFKPWIEEVFRSSVNQLRILYDLRMNLVIAKTAPVNLVVILKLQQVSASKFVLLPTCSDLIFFYWDKVTQATSGPPEYIEDESKAIFPVRFLVQGMVLFKDSLSHWSSIRKGDVKNGTVLSQNFVEQAVHILITRLIPLNTRDLGSWITDPEEWVNTEEKDDEQWEFEVRPCGERVLLTLCNQYPEFVTPLLATTFKDINVRPVTDLQSIIQKETIYCAIGRCASRLKEVIPFNEWLQEIAVLEVQGSDANYPILKRRIAWVIGKWVSEESVSPLNHAIWQILTHLLSSRGSGTDAVVRFTAAIALRRSVDTRNFDAKIVEPFLRTIIVELLQLVTEADTLEMKRKVMQSLNVVIEQSANFIVPCISLIAESIPHLCKLSTTNENSNNVIMIGNISENDFLFKSAILETVTKALEAAKEPSGSLRFVVVPLIRDSLSDMSRIHLDADALILWQAALRNGSTLQSVDGAPSLAELFPLAIALLSQNLDLLGDIRLIVESYVLLDSESILKMHARELFAAFRSALSQAIDTNIKYLLVSLNIVITLAPAELWIEPMHSSGLFSKLITTLIEDKTPTLILTEHIFLMARLALSNNLLYTELISATAAVQNKAESELWEGLLDQWWRRFDNMYEPQHRKLAAMGIASLVATGKPKILERLTSEIFNMWLDVFGEIKEALNTSDNDISSPLSHLVTYWRDTEEVSDAILEGTEGTLEFGRRKFMYSQDIVSTEKLTDFIAARLAEAQMKSGGPELFEKLYLQGADPAVVKQIWAELQGSGRKSVTNM